MNFNFKNVLSIISGGGHKKKTPYRKRNSYLLSSKLKGVTNMKKNNPTKLSRKQNNDWWKNSNTGRKKSYKNMTRKQKRLNKKWQKRQNRRYEDENNPLRKMTFKQLLDYTRQQPHVIKRGQQAIQKGYNNSPYFRDL
jgi:hypothetical protein